VPLVEARRSSRGASPANESSKIKDIEKAAIQDTMAAATFPEITFQSTTITVNRPINTTSRAC
jgi:hypothetical protein